VGLLLRHTDPGTRRCGVCEMAGPGLGFKCQLGEDSDVERQAANAAATRPLGKTPRPRAAGEKPGPAATAAAEEVRLLVEPEDDTYERSIEEAKLDLDYAIRLAELHARLYGRMKKATVFVSLLAGTAAVTSLISHSAIVVTISAIVVAVMSAADVVYDLGAMATAHDRDRRRFLKLRAVIDSLTLQAFDAKFSRICADVAPTLESLRNVARNDNLSRHGRYSSMRPEIRLERFMRAIA
jgi:hypothetical protein